MITMLHLSDLHTGADVDWENLKARILENAATLRKLPAGEKMLILTGDYRFYRDTNYNSTEAFLRQLIDIMQIDPVEDLFLIPGNHDVANQQMMQTLFLDDPDWAQKQKASIELIIADSQNIPMYLDWRMDSFLAFDEFAERLGARKKESRPSGVYVSTWRNKLNILHLNTVLAADGVHKDNQKLDVLTAAKDETWAGVDTSLPAVAIGHNNFYDLDPVQQDSLRGIFKNRNIQAYLCGDQHVRNDNKNTRMIFLDKGYNPTQIPNIVCGKSAGEEKDSYSEFGFYKHEWDPDSGKVSLTFCAWNREDAPGLTEKKSGTYSLKRQTDAAEKTDAVTVSQLGDTVVAAQKDRLLNRSILPWMKQKLSYRAILPELFFPPVLKPTKGSKEAIPYSGRFVLQNKHRNVVFSGVAGSGKSTLMMETFIHGNPDNDILYTTAKLLEEPNEYTEFIRSLLHGKICPEKSYTVIIDGIDEVPSEIFERILSYLKTTAENGKVHLWLGLRAGFYSKDKAAMEGFIDETYMVEQWDENLIHPYVERYSRLIGQNDLILKFEKAVKDNHVLSDFVKVPFNLVLLLYLLENDRLKTMSRYQKMQTEKTTLYNLYKSFFDCWVDNEAKRLEAPLDKNEISNKLMTIASKLYFGEKATLDCSDSVITDLLVFNENEDPAEFFHRNLCAFFFANFLVEEMKKPHAKIKSFVKGSIRNDVSALVSAAFAELQNKDEIQTIQNNLIRNYSLLNKVLLLPSISSNSKKERAVTNIKMAILYGMGRLPVESHKIESFFKKAYAKERDLVVKLVIAYSSVIHYQDSVGLDFAKKMLGKPKYAEAARSYFLTYYKDVDDDPLEYKDDSAASWDETRHIILHQWENDKIQKYIRYRVLNIPLVYAYVKSRPEQVFTEDELAIVKSVTIRVSETEFSAEEADFLRRVKETLVKELERRNRMRKG